jgi:serine/threonine protein phosphatase 1
MTSSAVPPRIYAIGDIHGRLDLLDRLIAAIADDFVECGGQALTTTLGDYIDRGPDSLGVIERLAGNSFPTPYIALKGNHDIFIERFLEDPGFGPHWRALGGLETLMSYGVRPGRFMTRISYPELASGLRTALPPEHLKFLRSLRPAASIGKYFFCHAGVRPGIALDRQSEDDLLWIRDEFLASTIDFGKIVVHGHTPVREPDVMPNRINIDTGACFSGRLTCVVLDENGHRFLQSW